MKGKGNAGMKGEEQQDQLGTTQMHGGEDEQHAWEEGMGKGGTSSAGPKRHLGCLLGRRFLIFVCI